MNINNINSTTYLQKNFEEFENLDFWQLKKILELIEKAKNMPKEEELEEIADLQDEIDDLENRLEDANDDYDHLQDKYDNLKSDYVKLKSEYQALQNGIE